MVGERSHHCATPASTQSDGNSEGFEKNSEILKGLGLGLMILEFGGHGEEIILEFPKPREIKCTWCHGSIFSGIIQMNLIMFKMTGV